METTSASEPAPPTKVLPGENGEPIWARMAGFPSWPARRCSRKEEESMTVPRAPKLKQTPVVFLGQRGEIGLIQDTSIAVFGPATMGEKFLPKKFKTDKAYRAAVVEATRIAQFQGVQFDAAFLETVQSCSELPVDSLCVTCGGSLLSGPLMECASCGAGLRHWHCFPRVDEGAWMCNGCCQAQGLPAGSLVPFAEEHNGIVGTPAEDSSPICRTDNETAARTTIPKTKAQPPKPANGTASASLVGAGGSNTGVRSAATNAGGDYSSANWRQSLIRKIYASLDSGNLPDAYTAHRNAPNDAVDGGRTDDECLICGQGGHLLLCDFPRCARAYHQVCVLRVCPSALDSILGANDHTTGLSTQSPLEEPWFCPCHTCVGCHALQEPAVELTVSQVPVSLLALQKAAQANVSARRGRVASIVAVTTAGAAEGENGNGSGDSGTSDTNSLFDAQLKHSTAVATSEVAAPSMQGLMTRRRSSGNNTGLMPAARHNSSGGTGSTAEDPERVSDSTGLRHRALRCCATCPFSICASCEKDVSGMTTDKGPLLQQRRYSDEELECLNCASKDPHMQLARILERAWQKTANSRLAVPFLHPLLPLSEEGSCNASVEAGYWSDLVKSDSTGSLAASGSTSNSSGSLAALLSPSTAPSGGKRAHSAMDIPKEGAVDLAASQTAHKRGRSCKSLSGPVASPVAAAAAVSGISGPAQETPWDLLCILDKIHALVYPSLEAYCTDLLKIRRAVEQKILRHSASATAAAAAGQQNSGVALQHSLLMAWDTIVEAGDALLVSKAGQIAVLEQKIRDDTGVKGSDRARQSTPAGKQQSAGSAASLMQSLWRAETFCVTPFNRIDGVCGLPNSLGASAHHGGLAPKAVVPVRSLAGWTVFVEQGAVPEEFRGSRSSDPYAVKEVVARAEHRAQAPARARDAVRAMLGEAASGLEGQDGICGWEAGAGSHTAEEWRAAQLMFGMQHSALREDVTLLEGAGDLVTDSSRFPTYFQSTGGYAPGVPDLLQPDDSMVILDRLREVTQTALQLEERLRREYIAKQRQLFETETETVTLGQASIITELKLANDNLRWRLQQKQSVIDAQQGTIAELRRQLEESRKSGSGASAVEATAVGAVENGVAVRTVSK